MTEKRKVLVLVVGIVVLGVLTFGVSGAAPAGDAVFTQEDGTPTPTPTENATNATANETNVTGGNVTVGTANVTFQNQTSNGSAVMVNSTVLPNGGFLVVYNQTMAAPLGNSSFIEAGTQQNVTVMLNESLTQNTTLVVVAFNDTNTNQQFDLGTDEVYLAQGQPVVAAAMVNVSAAGNVTTPTSTPTGNATTPTPTENVTTPTPEPGEGANET